MKNKGDGASIFEDLSYLGVEASLTGKRWISRDVDERISLMLSQRLGVSEIVGRVVASRNINVEDAESFLEPTLRKFLPDPSTLCDMDLAVERIIEAIMSNEKIGIFGDYDVDGATSSALLKRFFNAVDCQSSVYIPDRLKEGYGPNGPAMLRLKDAGINVVITVDCGTTASGPLEIAKNTGIDVIVVDHHVAEASLPPAYAIINPNRLDDESGQGELAAVGVAFLLIVAINRSLRKMGWYKSRLEPDLLKWLDIVALGTVCDVVPLKGVNRALVYQGLKIMASRQNPGIKALVDLINLNEAPTSFHIGYMLGPRVNAGGRVGASDLGTLLLSTDSQSNADLIANRLDGYNSERKIIEDSVLNSALDQINAAQAKGAVVFAVGEGWHPGVIGIVASRLKDRFNRPALVISVDTKNSICIGSARSVAGIDLGANIIAARQVGLLEKGGGHKMAAGFSLSPEKISQFQEFLNERIGSQIVSGGIKPVLLVDGSLSPEGVTTDLIDQIDKVAPFGSGNPEPIFVIPHAQIGRADLVGETHVRLNINKSKSGQIRGISFRSADRAHGQALLNHNGKPFHLAGRLRMNNWQGSSHPQFQVEDIAPAW